MTNFGIRLHFFPPFHQFSPATINQVEFNGMLRWGASCASRCHVRQWTGTRCFSASIKHFSISDHEALSRTRNIGIIAHIDAGKTTTTERMLFYSGQTRRIGDVDDGSTVTDFLPAEKARGITIQSAAVSFNWPPAPPDHEKKSDSISVEKQSRRSTISHNINLIDTPGHADFTFEVLRSLRILDGAVCILDGVAGVEAQTEKVWVQANHYKIPRLIFVNKLDRDGAAFHRTIKEIGSRLHVWPALCQIPWWRSGDRKLCGLGDVIGLRALLWKEGSDGKSIEVSNLEQLAEVDPDMAKELKEARIALVELLSEHDDVMVELFLEHDEDHLAIPDIDIIASLRRCTLHSPQHVVPVFSGASFRNIGVQPLMDAVDELLPSPHERPDPEIQIAGSTSTLSALLSGELALTQGETGMKSRKLANKSPAKLASTAPNLQGCALAFKVVSDAKRGVLVYVRVYSGSIARGVQLFNTNLGVTERAPTLLRMFANEAANIQTIDAGQIGVIVGLKHTRTGDTLLSYPGVNPKTGPPAPLNSLQLRPIAVPPPVFFTSVEPESLSEEKQIKDTLQILLREDPSLNVTIDHESGQTHLAGMGELHLEIARDRLIQDFKAKARIGKIEINYRESVEAAGKQYTYNLDREVGGKPARASSSASVGPLNASTISEYQLKHAQELPLPDNNHLTVLHPTLTDEGHALGSEDAPLPSHITFSTLISALKSGAIAALARGPTYGFPLYSTHITIQVDPRKQVFSDTSPAAISLAAREAINGTIRSGAESAGSALMEPVMLVTISMNENDLGSVVHDLSSARGGHIISLDGDQYSTPTSPLSEDEQLSVDTKSIYAPPDPFSSGYIGDSLGGNQNALRHITARVPLREMVGYLKHLRSLTGGRGTFVMQVDQFEKVTGQRLAAITKEMRGDGMGMS
jgi:elongation factor G